jgi:predicted enzyme involved in methoxymalonyl-ACP biosynthesis
MGRGVEIAVLNHLKRWCFETLRKAGITAELIPTAKNVPVRELFTEQGFSVSEELPGGARRYAMLAAEVIYPDCQWISLKARSHG